jgi:phospholipase/carboxylesterase
MQSEARCIIWLHGLGSNAENMRGVAALLALKHPTKHVFLDAPVRPITINGGLMMPAWYDIVGSRLTDREDRVGIMQSSEQITSVIKKEIQAGFSSQQIFLAGFSQGAAMALFTGLEYTENLGGIIALSGYLPLFQEVCLAQSREVPIFAGAGLNDTIVLPDWTRWSLQQLKNQGYQSIQYYEYPMEHQICDKEARDLSVWMNEEVLS